MVVGVGVGVGDIAASGSFGDAELEVLARDLCSRWGGMSGILVW